MSVIGGRFDEGGLPSGNALPAGSAISWLI